MNENFRIALALNMPAKPAAGNEVLFGKLV